MQVITELKNRGVADIFIACVDGLKGFPEAIEAVYPQTQMQLCSGVEEYQQAVDDAYQELERGDEPVRDTVRRKSPDGWTQLKLTYTESCLGPDEQPPL
jgi:hypothetical protein